MIEKKHINSVHLRIQIYICGYCNKKFYRKDNRESHVRGIHLNIRNNACHLCDKKYTTKQSLKAHNKRKHPQPEEQFDDRGPFKKRKVTTTSVNNGY